MLTEPRDPPHNTHGDPTTVGGPDLPLPLLSSYLGRSEARRLKSFPEGCISEFLFLLTWGVGTFWPQYAKRLETCKSAALGSIKIAQLLPPPFQNQNCCVSMPFLFPSCSLPLSPSFPVSLHPCPFLPSAPFIPAPTPLFLFLFHISFVPSCSSYLPNQDVGGHPGCWSPESGSTTHWHLQESRGVLALPMLGHQDDRETPGLVRRWPWAGSSTHGNVCISGLLGTYEVMQMSSSEKLNWPTITSHYSQR